MILILYELACHVVFGLAFCAVLHFVPQQSAQHKQQVLIVGVCIQKKSDEISRYWMKMHDWTKRPVGQLVDQTIGL